MARLSSISNLIARLSLSLRVQLILLAVISLTVPVLLYEAFQGADREKDALVLNAVRRQDVVIAKALSPLLQHLAPADFGQLSTQLQPFASDETSLKLLYKPNTVGGEAGFFYIASAPTVSPGDLAAERQKLVDLGILDRLATSCDGDQPLGERVQLPDQKGEILTSVAPLKTESGCWVLVVAAKSQSLLGEVSDLPYWRRPAVRWALYTYAGMAAFVLIMFGNLWLTLRRFRLVARDVEAGRSFADSTQIPELGGMAAEFDRMVGRLNDAAALLRRSAEDNAHAFKTPVAIIRQALEMMRRPIGPDRMQSAFDAVDASLAKLDGLIRSARRLDVATADLLETARHEFDLSSLIQGFVAEYRLMQGAGTADRLVADVVTGIWVVGREELVETILENLVDNAVSFSPPWGRVFVSLHAQDGIATLSVADEGPGVEQDRLTSIFERYYSERPTSAGREKVEGAHFGVGLWIVRQNASALGGHVAAANRQEGGFVVTVTLPLARSGTRPTLVEAPRARAAE
ncbi:MAG TPA: HAMP domain-containing sensor histidine kinase [Alphaproteobacteria bacterium]|nr:HAMP domain-containing sensor histidine kinase [Alphaproteobacteria bacterium]